MPVYGSDETVAVYDACSEFVDDCLVSDGSLIFNDDYWTEENLQELRTAFVDNPDESSDSFLEKFKRQLDEQDQDVIILASEALAVSLLFPSNIGKQRKLELVEEVLSWADRELPEGSMLDDAFNIGIGSGGQHYNTGRPFELGFLIKWAQQIKSVKPSARKAILSSPKKLKASLWEIDSDANHQMRHMLLHTALPDSFERIFSASHKRMVVNTFGALAGGHDDEDEAISIIRTKLQKLAGQPLIDFYDFPPVYETWFDRADPDGLGPLDLLRFKKQLILYGPPGTGKTYSAQILAERLITKAALQSWGATEFFQRQDELEIALESNVERIQLHASYGYEDFIRSLQLNADGATEYVLGFLPRLIQKIELEDSNFRLPTVLILDELNRTDLSRLLGEAFSLLEHRDVAVDLRGWTKKDKSSYFGCLPIST